MVKKRGKAEAKIQPMTSAERVVSLAGMLARLAADGLITLPTRKPLGKVRLAKVSGIPLSKVILEDRG